MGRSCYHKGRQDKNLASCKGCIPEKTVGQVEACYCYFSESLTQDATTVIVHVPERKRPDPSDRLANIIFDAEEALRKVALFPEHNRAQAWGDFIELRSHTKKVIDELHFLHSERKRARAKIEERIESLAGCTEGSAEEIELRVLADLLEPMSERASPKTRPSD